jgi:hypothetical protein
MTGGLLIGGGVLIITISGRLIVGGLLVLMTGGRLIGGRRGKNGDGDALWEKCRVMADLCPPLGDTWSLRRRAAPVANCACLGKLHLLAVGRAALVTAVSVPPEAPQVLSSTLEVVLDRKTGAKGNTMPGGAFEPDNDSLRWFVQNPDKAGTYFYPAYPNGTDD